MRRNKIFDLKEIELLKLDLTGLLARPKGRPVRTEYSLIFKKNQLLNTSK